MWPSPWRVARSGDDISRLGLRGDHATSVIGLHRGRLVREHLSLHPDVAATWQAYKPSVKAFSKSDAGPAAVTGFTMRAASTTTTHATDNDGDNNPYPTPGNAERAEVDGT